MGDDEEHAILLCNYFNYIDRSEGRQRLNANEGAGAGSKNYKSYLVYGEAVPRGETWFVGRLDLDNFYLELWDPQTGICYFFDNKVNQLHGAIGNHPV